MKQSKSSRVTPKKPATKMLAKKALAKSKTVAIKVATKDQIKKYLTKGLKQYKRTLKALEDK